MIHFREITEENVFDVIKLSETLDDYQKTCVAPNVISLAEAYVSKRAWPRAIYQDDELVGFIMLALHDDDIDSNDQPSYYLWRFMIAKEHQNKGYGKAALDLIIEKAKNDGQKYLYLSCETEGDMPYKFYIKYGFVDTFEKAEGEEILKLKL